MSLMRYCRDKSVDQFGNFTAFIVVSMAFLGSAYCIHRREWASLVCILLFGTAVIAGCVHWVLFRKLWWVKTDDDGIEYKIGQKTYKVTLAERVYFEPVPFQDGCKWGFSIFLVTPHGKLLLDNSIENVENLTREIERRWKLTAQAPN